MIAPLVKKIARFAAHAALAGGVFLAAFGAAKPAAAQLTDG